MFWGVIALGNAGPSGTTVTAGNVRYNGTAITGRVDITGTVGARYGESNRCERNNRLPRAGYLAAALASYSSRICATPLA